MADAQIIDTQVHKGKEEIRNRSAGSSSVYC